MLRGLIVLVCALALTAPVAAAQGDEIFVDPGSPSGKEYALPVESARQQAAKDAAQRSPSARAAPLFGEGVGGGSSTGQDGSSSAGGDASGGGGGAKDDADGGTPAARGAGAHAPTLKARAAVAADGGLGPAAVIGVGAGVLALGGAIGLLLRRRAARGG